MRFTHLYIHLKIETIWSESHFWQSYHVFLIMSESDVYLFCYIGLSLVSYNFFQKSLASLTKIQPLSSVLPVAHPSCHPLLCSSVPPIVFSFRIQLHLSHNHCFCSPSFCSSAAHFCCSLCIYAGALRGVWLVCSAPLWMGCVYNSGSAPFLASTVSSDGSSAITAHFINYHSNFSSLVFIPVLHFFVISFWLIYYRANSENSPPLTRKAKLNWTLSLDQRCPELTFDDPWVISVN